MWRFGESLQRVDLAEVVIHLYDAALASSSRRTYRTGQRAYLNFMQEVGNKASLRPFSQSELGKTELSLAFFIAFLVLKPSITSASTILGYEGHVKYMFREDGCEPLEYQTPFLSQVRCGVKNFFPQQPDARRAFLLPMCLKNPVFQDVSSKKKALARLVTILGFTGMLRPHTFTSLQQSSFVIVPVQRKGVRFHGENRPLQERLGNLRSREILGFYIEFKSKTLNYARAYFPNLSQPISPYSDMCPVVALKQIVSMGWLSQKLGKTSLSKLSITSYLAKVSSSVAKKVPLYALRIGGRTWNISQGMDRQFVDYLGTWKSPEASARYYREQPAAVLRKIRKFYYNLPEPSSL